MIASLKGAAEPSRALVGLRLVVLHVLRLVEHQPGPGQRVVGLEVDPEQGVRRHHQLGALDPFRERAGSAPLRLTHADHPEVRGEARSLEAPVVDDTRRCHDEERANVRIALNGATDQGQRLERLAEAHVVGEDPAEAVVLEEREPAVAGTLVGPQLRDETRGQVGLRNLVEVEQTLHGAGPPLALRIDDAQLRQVVPEPGLVAAHPKALRLAVLEAARLVDEPPQLVVLRPLDAEERAALEDQVALTQGEGGEEVLEGNLLAIDRDSDSEVEPVGTVRSLGRRDPHQRGALGTAVAHGGSDHLDLDVVSGEQRRQQLGREEHRIETGQPHRGHQPARPGRPGRPGAKHRQPVVRQPQTLEQPTLGAEVTKPRERGGVLQADVPGLVADRIAEVPVEAHLMVRQMRDGETEPWRLDLGKLQALVRGDDRDAQPQPRIVVREESGDIARGDLDRALGGDQPEGRLAERLRERCEQQAPLITSGPS